MINSTSATRRFFWKPAVRCSIEYAVAVGAALLCGYWIVQGRW